VAHSHGIVHRDIKPENVLVTRTGELKVLDFGIARLRDGSVKTATGDLIGTPAFMPPEQAGGYANKVDARTDVWAVGALMFTSLSGEHVHPARALPHQLVLAATQRARALGPVAQHVPVGIATIVDRALAFEREERWPSAAAMHQAIRAVSVESVPPPVAAPSAPVRAGPTLPLGRMSLDAPATRKR
jgi:serine/threonine-protein kinase